MEKPKISPSQLKLFGKCGIQYYYRYIENIIIPPSASLVVGKAAHKGIEANINSVIATGEMLPVVACEDIAATAFNDFLKEENAISNEEKGQALERTREDVS